MASKNKGIVIVTCFLVAISVLRNYMHTLSLSKAASSSNDINVRRENQIQVKDKRAERTSSKTYDEIITPAFMKFVCNTTHWSGLLGYTEESHGETCTSSSDHEKLRKLLTVKAIDVQYAEALKRFSTIDGNIMIIMADYGYLDMTMNFYLTSLRRFSITNYLFLAMDIKIRDFLHARQLNYYYYKINVNTDKASTYNSYDFNFKCSSRFLYILHALLLGYNVLNTDVDIVYLKDPWPFVLNSCSENCDILYQADTVTGTVVNTGFLYSKSTPYTKLFYLAFQNTLDAAPGDNEQMVINAKVVPRFKAKSVLKIIPLPLSQFANGLQWFDIDFRFFQKDHISCNSCVIVHNNYIVGKIPKVHRFKEAGLWYVDDNQYYSDPNRRYLTVTLNTANYDDLKRMITLALVLNRTLILPKFMCGFRECTIVQALSKTFVAIDSCYSNYREHNFLDHPLVPEVVKNSVVNYFGNSMNNSLKCNISSVKPGNNAHITISSCFPNESHSVVRVGINFFAIPSVDETLRDLCTRFSQCKCLQ